MTLISARFGTEYLATQSILITLTTLSYQIPFPLSIAASTRVASLIGAGQVHNAKVAARVVSGVGACFSEGLRTQPEITSANPCRQWWLPCCAPL